ncbi:MAG: serine protease [Candidatus Electrothrix aestuarii]|uniref:Serine protease n=1 Tax=Candidatus Electrothrix aestuarii TaxID=3062594 RepID=A0AAU8LWU8_9BACT|nr:serine protease [Candidatus Electrothrix aestuarii]
MALNYPENTVWYIEACRWNGTKDSPGFALVDESPLMGSGVVVTLRLTDEGISKSYILTCAHVVRGRVDDLLREDIICYPPDTGFIKTSGNNRRSGAGIALALPANVSKYSPCMGAPGGRDEKIRNDPALDWVLLEINNPSFRHHPSAKILDEDDLPDDQLFDVIGFPAGGEIWRNGEKVLPATAKNFRLRAHARPGMLSYEGPEETRRGMSGGGIIDDRGFLAGIHRAATDAAMRRTGIRADAIVRYLRATHNLEPVTPEGQLFSTPMELEITVNRITPNFGLEPISGLKVGFDPLDHEDMKGEVTEGETDADGRAVIKFIPENPDSDILGHLICLNQPVELIDDAPLILSPYGKFPDGLRKEDEIQLPYKEMLPCTVWGIKAYLYKYFAKFFPPTPTNDIKKIVKKAVAAGLSEKETKLATQGWADILKYARPVLRLSSLEDYFQDESPVLREMSESVGQVLHSRGVSTCFLLAGDLVLLPEFILPSDDSTDIKISFWGTGQTEHREVSKVIWKSKEFMSALCEIPQSTKKPFMIGLTGDISLLQNKIVVIGFPRRDSRLPEELNSFFELSEGQPAVMPGEVIIHDPELSQIHHDATTSGGVAGSPVVDMQSNSVIAMHVGGKFAGTRKENFAVTLQALWEEPSFREVLQLYDVNVKKIT